MPYRLLERPREMHYQEGNLGFGAGESVMVSMRRIGSANSAVRSALIEAAAELMGAEGHGAVTVRRLAERAAVKWQIIHYYFRSMEELYLEVVRRSAELYLERQREALARPDPLRAIWELTIYSGGIRLEAEFMALANRLPSVRTLLADFMSRSRDMQTEALLRAGGGNEEVKPPANGPKPEAMALIMRAIARALVMEAELGVTSGHEATLEAIENYLDAAERGASLRANEGVKQ